MNPATSQVLTRSTTPLIDPPAASVAAAARALIAAARAVRQRPDPDGPLVDITVDGYRCVVGARAPDPDPAVVEGVVLSPREAEVARMVCDGLTNRAIASVLDISPWTVGTHLRRIFGKLDVTSRAAMVARLLAAPPADVTHSRDHAFARGTNSRIVRGLGPT